MELTDCIRTRRSVRKYIDKPIPWELVTLVLDAGRMAPSAGNLQNWRFIVVKDEGRKKKIAEAAINQSWMEKAAVHIVVVGEPEKSKAFYGVRGERIYTIQNCAAAVENMLLAAHDAGLGACWVGAFDEFLLAKAIALPDLAVPYAIMTLGYADEKPMLPPKFRIEHVTYLERWWTRRKPPAQAFYSERITPNLKKVKKFLEGVANKIRKEK